MLYRLLKFLIGIGIRLYYKEIRITNKKYLNTKNPLIIISNHPNTLMDAWVVGMICNQPIYYMAKATLFDSSWKLKLFRSLNMIPINRKGEGITKGVDNDFSLEECYHILEERKTLLIFPEGTSYKERVLRKLKTGTARIALETESRNKGKLGLKVIAIGLNYSQPEKFRSRILINVDAPESISPYLDEYHKNGHETAQKLTTQFRKRLEKVLFTTETKEDEETLNLIYNFINSKYQPKKEKGVSAEVVTMREIKDRLDELKIVQPWLLNEIELKIRSMNWKLEKMKIRSDLLDRKFRSRLFFRQLITSVFFIVLAFPLFIFGLIHHIGQFKLTDFIIPKLSKDIEYYAPFAVFIGVFLYPFSYLLFIWGIGYQLLRLPWYGLLGYMILLPLSGLFAYWFIRYLTHISFKWQYMFLMVDRKEALEELKKEKIVLRKMIFED